MDIELKGKGIIYDVCKEYLLNKDDINIVDKGDILVCIGNPHIYTREEIESYNNSIINLHFSLLPKYRGRHPVNWAMIEGETEIGLTVHYIDEGIDTGDIIVQQSFPINITYNYAKVMDEICKISPGLLYLALKQIEMGLVCRRTQPKLDCYYTKRRKPEDSQVLIEHKTIRKIQAMDGPNMPPAFVKIGNKKLCLQISKVLEENT